MARSGRCDVPTLYLDGAATPWVIRSLRIDTAIEERSTASFVVADTAETNTATKGTPVVITDVNDAGEEVYVFAGVVDSTSRRAIVTPDGAGIFVTVACTDSHYFVDKRIIAEGFTSSDIGTIAKALLAEYLQPENIYDHPYPGAAVALARTDLLGYWRLAADATDDSYLGNDGTDTGTPTYSGAGTGSPVGDDHLGGYFDGTTVTGVETTLTAAEMAAAYAAGGLTISAWVQKDSAGYVFNYAYFLGDDGVLGNGDFTLSLRYDGNTATEPLIFSVYTSAGWQTATVIADPMPLDEWFHTVVTIAPDGGNTRVRTYVDGALVVDTVKTGAPNFAQTLSNFRIGQDEGTGNSWDGLLSEVQVIGREFTPDEVAALHRAAGESYGTAVARSGAVARWPLTDAAGSTTAVEVIGGEDGTVSNASQVTFGATPAGVPGGTAVDFLSDNTTGHIDTPVATNVASSSASWTWAAWVRFPALADDDDPNPVVISEGDSTTNYVSWLYNGIGDPVSTLRVYLSDGVGNPAVTFSGTYAREQWHYFVSTYNFATDTLDLYANGSLVNSDSTTPFGNGFGPATVTPGSIGALQRGGSVTNDFSGLVQDVAKWDRHLTADEVADLYYKGAAYYDAGHTDAPASRIADGPTLTSFAVNYQPASEAFEELAELGEFDYFVDPYRTLHLHGRGAACCTVPFTVNDSVILSADAELTTEAPKYRNKQYLKGGKDRTVSQVETQDGDGDKRSFLTGYAIVEEPTIEVDRGAGFVAETVGIRGVETGNDWYWSKGDFSVTQDTGGTVLATTDQIRITYTGQFPIVAIATDEAERLTVRGIEKSGSGTVETAIEDASVDSRAVAFDIASSKLERFANRGQTIRFITRSAGLRAGQVGTITLNRLGLSETMLIDTVEFIDDDADGAEVRYRVTAVTGPVLQSWRQFFARPAKRLIVPTERVNIGQEEIITVAVPFTATITLTPVVDPGSTACEILDGTSTFPFTLC